MKRNLLQMCLPTLLLSAYCGLIVLDLVAFWVVAIFALIHTITLWFATSGFENILYPPKNNTALKRESLVRGYKE